MKDNTIILLDVGANTNDKDVDGKRYYDEAKRCIEAIITRKVIFLYLNFILNIEHCMRHLHAKACNLVFDIEII